MFFRCPNLCVGMCSMSLFPPAPLCQFSPSNGRSHRWDCNLTSHLLAQFHQQIPSEGLSLVWRGTTSLQEFPVLGMSWLSFQVCASCTSRWQRCDSVQPSDKILIKKEKPTLKPIFVRLGLNSLTLAYRTPRDPFWAVKIGLLDVQGNQLEISYWKLISRSWWENSNVVPSKRSPWKIISNDVDKGTISARWLMFSFVPPSVTIAHAVTTHLADC